MARPELEGVGLLSGLAPAPGVQIPLPWFLCLFIHKFHTYLLLSTYSVPDIRDTVSVLQGFMGEWGDG